MAMHSLKKISFSGKHITGSKTLLQVSLNGDSDGNVLGIEFGTIDGIVDGFTNGSADGDDEGVILGREDSDGV